MKLFDSVSLAVGIVITAYVAAADATTASPTAIMDITTSNPVIIDLSKDFVTSNSFNDSPGMDMVNELAESWPNTRIVTVIQDGKIVGEYVRDDDVDPTELRPINSVTKAVSGMLFGILVDQYDTSINTTLGEFFPNETDWNLVDNEATVDYMKSLSAYEILTMTTGLGDNPCWMIGNCTSAIGGRDLQSTLAWPIINKKGERSKYNYMAAWNILSYIIREVTGLTPRELLAEEILPAIGIDDADYEWPLESNGFSLDVQQGAGGMELTTKQMAKIGQLVIQKGLAAPEGTQILSSEWIEASLSPKVPVPAASAGGSEGAMYGYQQWYSDGTETSKEFGESYVAAGGYGQFIVVHPQSGIVLAIQSDESSDSTYDPEFDCSSCTWFLSLFNEGSDFFVSTNSPNNSSVLSPPPAEKEDSKEEDGSDNSVSDSSNSSGIIPAPQLMSWGSITSMFTITYLLSQ